MVKVKHKITGEKMVKVKHKRTGRKDGENET